LNKVTLILAQSQNVFFLSDLSTGGIVDTPIILTSSNSYSFSTHPAGLPENKAEKRAIPNERPP
jgi:hypothetical protein